jgi:hypothetical protein
MKALLNTPDGKVLVAELEGVWDTFSLLGDTPELTAYAVGQRDAYKFLKDVQTGALDGND